MSDWKSIVSLVWFALLLLRAVFFFFQMAKTKKKEKASIILVPSWLSGLVSHSFLLGRLRKGGIASLSELFFFERRRKSRSFIPSQTAGGGAQGFPFNRALHVVVLNSHTLVCVCVPLPSPTTLPVSRGNLQSCKDTCAKSVAPSGIVIFTIQTQVDTWCPKVTDQNIAPARWRICDDMQT